MKTGSALILYGLERFNLLKVFWRALIFILKAICRELRVLACVIWSEHGRSHWFTKREPENNFGGFAQEQSRRNLR